MTGRALVTVARVFNEGVGRLVSVREARDSVLADVARYELGPAHLFTYKHGQPNIALCGRRSSEGPAAALELELVQDYASDFEGTPICVACMQWVPQR